jgi:cytochrome c oxidase subunit IV
MSSEHIVPTRVYYGVFGALMVFTALTSWVAFVDLGSFNLVVALGIAIIKATLVILFFMHVKYSTTLTKAVVATGFFFFLILVFFTMADLLTRNIAAPGR